eukprot:1104198-Prorocentrum_minimum.AAC.1
MTAAAAKLRQNATKRCSPRLAVESGVGDTRPEWFKVHPDNDNQPTKGAPRAAKGVRSVRTSLQHKLEPRGNELGIEKTQDRKGGPHSKKIRTKDAPRRDRTRRLSPTSNSSDGDDGDDNFNGADRQFQEGSHSEPGDGGLLSASSEETEYEPDADVPNP